MQTSQTSWKHTVWAVGIGTFMSSLDSSVVNISLPQMSGHFGISIAAVEWVVMAYLLIISSLLLMYGRIGDLYGNRRVYLAGFVIFTAGSLFCGLSPTLPALVASRVFQAVGAGMLMAMGPAIITAVAPPQERGKALGMNGVAVSVALAFGPVLGGLLTTMFGWQSIFYINLPIGVAGYLLGRRFLPADGPHTRQHFDVPGAALFFLAMIALLFPMNYGDTAGWTSPLILGSFAASAALLAGFAAVELKSPSPMMDLTLFLNRLFTMSNISLLISFVAGFAVTLLMPFYLQDLRGLSASAAGLLLIPQPLVTMLAGPVSGVLSDRMDSRYLSSGGMLLVAVGMFLLSTLNISSTALQSSLFLVLLGLGNGVFQTPNNSSIMGSVPDNRRGVASGMLATMRNVGMVVGTALSGAVFSGRQAQLTAALKLKGVAGQALKVQSFTGAFHFTYVMAGVLALVAVGASLTRGPLNAGAGAEGDAAS